MVDSEAQGDDAVNEAILEAGVTAVLGGHDLGHWESTKTGWQAACKMCGATIWVGKKGVIYDLLADNCPRPPLMVG